MPDSRLFASADVLPLGELSWGDLPREGSLEAAMERLVGDGRVDSAFLHDPRRSLPLTPHGTRRGVDVFGPGVSPEMTDDALGQTTTREVASVFLHDARFVGSSMSIIDQRGRVFRDGLDNIGTPQRLADFDPHYRLQDERLHLNDDFDARAVRLDCLAMPVCGVGFPNYGHFLYDGLPAAVLFRQMFPRARIRLVGQELREWQRQILAALDLLDGYVSVTAPIIFRRMIASTMLSMHVSYPTAFARPLFDGLRFRLGIPRTDRPRLIMLSRAGDVGRRWLRNREAVERRVADLGFTIVRPEHLSFLEQVALMSSAELVVGESGAAMANIGFCPPGARVLEIQPERFVENWTRGMCFHFGHRWSVYLGRVDSAMIPDAAGQATDPNQVFSYEVDPDDLADAVTTLLAQP